MLNAIQQRVLVQDGGRVEVTSSELPVGAEADVIVLVRNGNAAASTMTKIEALRALQASMNLTPEAAQRWIDDARAERQAWGDRG